MYVVSIANALADAQMSKDSIDGLITCKSVQGTNTVDDVGPLCCIVNAHMIATRASDTTIEMRPKARPIARGIGLWASSLEPDA